MAKYFSIRNSTQSPFSVPLKLQAETIRNDGTEDIFILGPEDDEPVNQASLLVYSVAIVRPGQGVDVANSPYVNMYAKNGIDKFVTLHAAQTIKAGIVSNDAPEDWENDPKHFWNGQPFLMDLIRIVLVSLKHKRKLELLPLTPIMAFTSVVPLTL
jgi:hypothetical protein